MYEQCSGHSAVKWMLDMEYKLDAKGIFSEAFIVQVEEMTKLWGSPLGIDIDRPSATFMNVPSLVLSGWSDNGGAVKWQTDTGLDRATMNRPHWVIALNREVEQWRASSKSHADAMVYFANKEVAESFASIYIEIKLKGELI